MGQPALVPPARHCSKPPSLVFGLVWMVDLSPLLIPILRPVPWSLSAAEYVCVCVGKGPQCSLRIRATQVLKKCLTPIPDQF